MNKAGHNRRNRSNLVRKENGFSTVALILVIVFFAVLPAALFAFEAARASLVQIELQNITDASALGGTAYLAGSADLTLGNTITNNQIATLPSHRWDAVRVVGTLIKNKIRQPTIRGGNYHCRGHHAMILGDGDATILSTVNPATALIDRPADVLASIIDHRRDDVGQSATRHTEIS